MLEAGNITKAEANKPENEQNSSFESITLRYRNTGVNTGQATNRDSDKVQPIQVSESRDVNEGKNPSV